MSIAGKPGDARTGIHLFIADWSLSLIPPMLSIFFIMWVGTALILPSAMPLPSPARQTPAFVCATKDPKTMSQATTFWRLAGMTYLEVRKQG